MIKRIDLNIYSCESCILNWRGFCIRMEKAADSELMKTCSLDDAESTKERNHAQGQIH
jgi:hypothetical protein